MGTKTAKNGHRIGQLGSTTYGLHAMYDSAGFDRPSVALRFGSDRATAITVEFYAGADEAREFARQLVEYADAADKAQADAQQVAA